jgi:hypothetical protein
VRLFKAGVRDGQQVLGMSISWNDVNKPVRLTVRAAGGQQIINYTSQRERSCLFLSTGQTTRLGPQLQSDVRHTPTKFLAIHRTGLG